MISRRTFLQLTGAGALSVLAAEDAMSATTEVAALEERVVHLHNLPPEFEGYRIGLLSDLHYGSFTGEAQILSAIEELLRLKPDLLLLGGDYIGVGDSMRHPGRAPCCTVGKSKVEVAAELFAGAAKLLSTASAPDGVFAVYGNHDRHIPLEERTELLKRSGVQALVNESTFIRRGSAALELVGTDDLLYGTPWLPARADRETPRLVLTHNPDLLSLAHAHLYQPFELGLAGHTHGGQIKLPLVGAVDYNIEDRRLAEGLVQLSAHSYCYTSRGIGTVTLPFRVNCPPEITVLTLSGEG